MDINREEYAETVEVFRCPNCREYFMFAPRCPHCGQLISNGKANIQAVREALYLWSKGKDVVGIKKPNRGALFTSLIYGTEKLYIYGKYSTISQDEIEYWKFFGFDVKPEGIGWAIS